MKPFNYYSPTEIVFGPDAEKQTGELCKKHGGTRIFIVYGGGSVVKNGLLDTVTKSIEEVGLCCTSMGGVVPNPLLSTAKAMIAKAIEFKADMILGIGGGSAIDTAKMVAHGTANPGIDPWAFWTGTKVEKTIPIGCVPTLPATGTETSDSSVITNDEVSPRQKRGLSTNLHRCVFTAMNPNFCMSLPKYQIGAGAADIFMHNAERFFTLVQGNHLSDEFNLGLARNIMKYGREVIDNPSDYNAWSEVMWSGTEAHIGLTGLGAKGDTGREGDWSCHQLGHSLSALYDATHGASLTAVFGSWARYVCDADYSRFAEFARKALGLDVADDKDGALKAIEGIEKFFTDIGMPITITDLVGKELSDEQIDELAVHCSFEKTRTIGSFKVIDVDAMRTIYSNAR